MIIEYAGRAERHVGWGITHEVRAWWNVNLDSDGTVKRAALDAVRAEVAEGYHVEYVSRDMSTYNTPRLDAMYLVRVLSPEQTAQRAELRTRRYTSCTTDTCPEQPGYLVRMDADGTERALCYGCWAPIKSTCKVLHWIKADGNLQV